MRSQQAGYRSEGRYRERYPDRPHYYLTHPGYNQDKYLRRAPRPHTCKWCGESFRSKQDIATYCSTECMSSALSALNTKVPSRECAKCGAFFKPARMNRQQREAGYVQQHCSYQCAGMTPKPKTATRNQRSKELRIRGYWKPVDPKVVFERDGWKCHLCGVKTPKSLRGTTDDRAPELDHIVPIAAGGTHSYENTACACRRCNREKGSKPLGQLLLFG